MIRDNRIYLSPVERANLGNLENVEYLHEAVNVGAGQVRFSYQREPAVQWIGNAMHYGSFMVQYSSQSCFTFSSMGVPRDT